MTTGDKLRAYGLCQGEMSGEEIVKAADELDALTADNRKLRELLRNFEWVRYNLATGIKGCRICGGDFPHHRPDCALDAALKEGK